MTDKIKRVYESSANIVGLFYCISNMQAVFASGNSPTPAFSSFSRSENKKKHPKTTRKTLNS